LKSRDADDEHISSLKVFSVSREATGNSLDAVSNSSGCVKLTDISYFKTDLIYWLKLCPLWKDAVNARKSVLL
jgi:hypothetical protein